MMRWSYKTVLYELKKEGFLGSAFLDEVEVEQSLNEYGRSGWELVSMMETQDGLIAIFKQPLTMDGAKSVTRESCESSGEEDGDVVITEDDIIEDVSPIPVKEQDDGIDSIRIE